MHEKSCRVPQAEIIFSLFFISRNLPTFPCFLPYFLGLPVPTFCCEASESPASINPCERQEFAMEGCTFHIYLSSTLRSSGGKFLKIPKVLTLWKMLKTSWLLFSCLQVDEFHEYVRPVINPKLSEFCVTLTGIPQVSWYLDISLQRLECYLIISSIGN